MDLSNDFRLGYSLGVSVTYGEPHYCLWHMHGTELEVAAAISRRYFQRSHRHDQLEIYRQVL